MGIDRERLFDVDRSKVEEALDVVPVSEEDVYDVSESEYVRRLRWTNSAKRRAYRDSKIDWRSATIPRRMSSAKKSSGWNKRSRS